VDGTRIDEGPSYRRSDESHLGAPGAKAPAMHRDDGAHVCTIAAMT
jgi:hypothetical protein